MVALVEEDEAEEEDVEGDELRMNLLESNHGDKEELTIPDHGTSLVIQMSLKIRAAPSKENWLRSNVFHTKCDAPKPGGPLTTRQPAEYKWRSGYPTPL